MFTAMLLRAWAMLALRIEDLVVRSIQSLLGGDDPLLVNTQGHVVKDESPVVSGRLRAERFFVVSQGFGVFPSPWASLPRGN